jgi:hypothetical protein
MGWSLPYLDSIEFEWLGHARNGEWNCFEGAGAIAGDRAEAAKQVVFDALSALAAVF